MSGGRFALLVATGRYENSGLNQLRSPVRDAEGLAQVLRDPQIGDFEVETLVDGQQHEVNRAIERFFLDRRRDDLLLLHISCHGIKNDNGELHFATRDTNRKLLASTAVSAEFLRTQMSRCRARSIVLLLDCCYSGAFLPGSKGDTMVHVQDELAGHGRVVLTATNRTEYAWEGDHLNELEPEPSQFTGAIIDGLRSGEADGNRDGLVSVHDLYDYVYEQMHASRVRQRPQMWAELEYQVIVAHSVLHPRQNKRPKRMRDSAVATDTAPPHEFPQPRRQVPEISGGGPVHRRQPERTATSSLQPEGNPASQRELLLRLADALCGLGCLEDAQGRLQFAAVLGDQLGRQIDMRGIKLREDAVTLVRAALNVEGGEHLLVSVVRLLEGTAAGDNLDRLIGSEGDPSPQLEPLLWLTDALCGLGCLEDAQGRLQFAAVLGDQLGRQIDMRGIKLREDAVTLVRAALNVEGGEHLLVSVVRLLEGTAAGDNLDRLIAHTALPR
ncbi:caspase family protein [Streptomyces sp. NPDC002928]|uniref:caspase, EACC1-associated type n=1 Tax=Streptomyces sp. NPDC002928 TaxID=3154440 RepID=UPI0033B0BB85